MKRAKIIPLDERGRITLPPEAREGVTSYEVEICDEGVLKLIPHKSIPLKEAKILESLMTSVGQMKRGQTKKVPGQWIDED